MLAKGPENHCAGTALSPGSSLRDFGAREVEPCPVNWLGGCPCLEIGAASSCEYRGPRSIDQFCCLCIQTRPECGPVRWRTGERRGTRSCGTCRVRGRVCAGSPGGFS